MRNLRIIRRNIEFHSLENNLPIEDRQIVLWTNEIVSKIEDMDVKVSLIEGLNQLKSLFDSTFNFNHSDLDEIIGYISDEEAKIWILEKYFMTLSGIDGITVNTIHQSKGLEYEAVILNEVNEGKIPYQSWDRVNRIRGVLTNDSLEDGRTKLPHVYSHEEQRLCLYSPNKAEWTREKLISSTIIPWAVEWLQYYELWLPNGKWLGGGHDEYRED